MRVHGSQEPITERHGTGKDTGTSPAPPTGLNGAHESNDIAGVLGLWAEIDLVRRKEEVLETLPRLNQFVVLDVELCGRGTWKGVNNRFTIGLPMRDLYGLNQYLPDGFQIEPLIPDGTRLAVGTRPLDGRDGQRDHREAVQSSRGREIEELRMVIWERIGGGRRRGVVRGGKTGSSASGGGRGLSRRGRTADMSIERKPSLRVSHGDSACVASFRSHAASSWSSHLPCGRRLSASPSAGHGFRLFSSPPELVFAD